MSQSPMAIAAWWLQSLIVAAVIYSHNPKQRGPLPAPATYFHVELQVHIWGQSHSTWTGPFDRARGGCPAGRRGSRVVAEGGPA